MEMVMPDGAVASADIERLRVAYARRLLRGLVERAQGADVVRRLLALHKAAPEEAETLLVDPTVSVALETGATASALASLSVSLAARSALGPRRRSLAPVRRVASLDANLVVEGELSVEDGTLFCGDVAIPLRRDAQPDDVTRPFPVIEGRVLLALHDANPLALHETHPDKDGNAVSLGDRPLEAWLDALRTAFGLVKAHLPGIYDEMRALLRLVIPVGASDERHLSASYREYVGAVYLTLHREPLTMAEALVHEFQHNKLNLLSFHYPILENGYDFLYRSPVRPDPRPLMGILLAAHAFIPVAELYRRVLEAGVERDAAGLRTRLAQIVARNEEALTVLERHARPAKAGEILLARLRAIHATHLGATPELPENVSHVA